MSTKRAVILALIVVLIIAVGLVACTAEPAESEPTSNPLSNPPSNPPLPPGANLSKGESGGSWLARLVCAECAEIGMKITIWKDSARSGVAGTIPHNTIVTVLSKSSGGGYYKIEYGYLTGWVPIDFIE